MVLRVCVCVQARIGHEGSNEEQAIQQVEKERKKNRQHVHPNTHTMVNDADTRSSVTSTGNAPWGQPSWRQSSFLHQRSWWGH